MKSLAVIFAIFCGGLLVIAVCLALVAAAAYLIERVGDRRRRTRLDRDGVATISAERSRRLRAQRLGVMPRRDVFDVRVNQRRTKIPAIRDDGGDAS